MSTKPKVATVPKWKPPEPFEIRRLRFLLRTNKLDRRERERAEEQIAEYKRNLK